MSSFNRFRSSSSSIEISASSSLVSVCGRDRETITKSMKRDEQAPYYFVMRRLNFVRQQFQSDFGRIPSLSGSDRRQGDDPKKRNNGERSLLCCVSVHRQDFSRHHHQFDCPEDPISTKSKRKMMRSFEVEGGHLRHCVARHRLNTVLLDLQCDCDPVRVS